MTGPAPQRSSAEAVPSHTSDDPRTACEHRRARRAAERRRASAQREFDQLQREVRRDLRSLRRRGETSAIVARSALAELGIRGLARWVSAVRAARDDR